MHILVTGAAGFIGSHVVKRLLADGHTVTGVDNFSDYYAVENKRRNVEGVEGLAMIEGDIADTAVLAQAFANAPDWVIHLAAQPGVRASLENPARTQKNNVEGTYAVFEAARAAGVRNVVFASSSSVYGGSTQVPFREDESLNKPLSPYAASKQACELIAYTYHHLYQMNMIGLRFFTVYGENGRPDMSPWLFVDAIVNERELTQFGDGSSERDFTYIGDIVNGIVACLDKSVGYEIINLGNNSPVKLRDYIALLEEIISQEMGHEVKANITQLPDQPGDMKRTCADISKAGQLLGWQPQVQLRDGLTRMVQWWLKNIA